jgi:hypothetical protein
MILPCTIQVVTHVKRLAAYFHARDVAVDSVLSKCVSVFLGLPMRTRKNGTYGDSAGARREVAPSVVARKTSGAVRDHVLRRAVGRYDTLERDRDERLPLDWSRESRHGKERGHKGGRERDANHVESSGGW